MRRSSTTSVLFLKARKMFLEQYLHISSSKYKREMNFYSRRRMWYKKWEKDFFWRNAHCNVLQTLTFSILRLASANHFMKLYCKFWMLQTFSAFSTREANMCFELPKNGTVSTDENNHDLESCEIGFSRPLEEIYQCGFEIFLGLRSEKHTIETGNILVWNRTEQCDKTRERADPWVAVYAENSFKISLQRFVYKFVWLIYMAVTDYYLRHIYFAKKQIWQMLKTMNGRAC